MSAFSFRFTSDRRNRGYNGRDRWGGYRNDRYQRWGRRG
jgi:hypothetical protein